MYVLKLFVTMQQCYQASADFADQMVGRLIDKHKKWLPKNER